MENIIHYARPNRSVHLTTMSSSIAGICALEDMHAKLRFAGNELLRMEDESGHALSEIESASVYTCLDTAQRIKIILDHARRILSPYSTARPVDNN